MQTPTQLNPGQRHGLYDHPPIPVTVLSGKEFGANLSNTELAQAAERNKKPDCAKNMVLREVLPGMQVFNEAFKPDRLLLVGGDGIAVEDFLCQRIERWLA